MPLFEITICSAIKWPNMGPVEFECIRGNPKVRCQLSDKSEMLKDYLE